MKSRYGWVSNSSTTSFCVVGMPVDEDKIIEVDDIDFEDESQVKGLEGFWTEGAIEAFKKADWDRSYAKNILEDEFGVCVHSGEDGTCVGIEFSMDDDETWGQCKKRAADKLAAVFVKPGKVGLHYDAEYEG